MLKRLLPGFICAILSLLCYVIITFFLGVFLGIPFGLLKLIAPTQSLRYKALSGLHWVIYMWAKLNQWQESIFVDCHWEITGIDNLDKNEWYLIVLNHQSWVDIMAMFQALNGRIPTTKFFIKRPLIWLPIIGQMAWICDFPFMRRYTEAELKKDPSKRGKDIAETRKACEKFRDYPISVCSFVEGTRFTEEKHKSRKSPYQYLLRPKAGGVGFVMGAMGDILHKVIDVTIVYPNGKKTFWDYLSGKTQKIIVHVRTFPITEELVGDYFNDRAYKNRFQDWLNQLWQEKDERIKTILNTEQS